MNNNLVQVSTKKFSKSEALSFAWKALTANFGFVTLSVFITLVIGNIPSIVFMWAHPFTAKTASAISSPDESNLAAAFSLLWMILFLPVVYKIAFKLYEDKNLNPKDLIPDFKKVWKLFLLILLLVLMSLIAVILFTIFLIPIIMILRPDQGAMNLIAYIVTVSVVGLFILIFVYYISIKLTLILCSIVDRASGPLQCVKESWVVTKNNVLNFFILSLLLFLPLLWNIPLTASIYFEWANNNLLAILNLIGTFASNLVYMFYILSIVYAYRKLSSSSANKAATQ